MNTYILPILAFLTALIITTYSIPVIIQVAVTKRLYDKPGGRKTHKGHVPNLGGIAIFAAFLITFISWTDFTVSTTLQYLILGLIILHYVGVKDDLVPLNPFKKLLGQLVAASILVVPGRLRINDLYGILGIHSIPPPVSIAVSIFAVVVVVNSFNLIDGIDGLAAGISLLISATYGYIFWLHGMDNMLIAAVAICGALIGFLYYNKQPAKIFMGDAGSMGIGYLVAAFSFQYINMDIKPQQPFHHNPALVIALLIIPLFDTLRVFTLRILNKKSPFAADCNHIHHKLLDLGLGHREVTLVLCAVNILFIWTAYLIGDLNPNLYIIIIAGIATILTTIPVILHQQSKKKVGKLFKPTLKIISASMPKEIRDSTPLPDKEVASHIHQN